MAGICISNVSVENLRGYEFANLDLSRKRTILIGENNEGKSSLLKMLSRLLSMDVEVLRTTQNISDEDYQFWLPANDARKKARRLTITVQFKDNRTAKKYEDYGVRNASGNLEVKLRFSVSKNTRTVRLNLGKPKRSERHDMQAVNLLSALAREVSIILMQPIRDASTSEFAKKATREVRDNIEASVMESSWGGKNRDYRDFKTVQEALSDVVGRYTTSLSKSNVGPLRRMLKDSQVRLDLTKEDIISFISERLDVYLTTGDHDSLMVKPEEVGNGLQSVLDISLTIANELDHGKNQVLLIIEEPEAFLHPVAQRDLLNGLRSLESEKLSVILTTHSPIIVDESYFPEAALVREHKIYQAHDVDDSRRSMINSSLLSVANSEVFFSRVVLLVEGPGDQAFFNVLLKRLRNETKLGSFLNTIVVQAVGGCHEFISWEYLLRSYSDHQGLRPIKDVMLLDADAVLPNEKTSAFGKYLNDSGIKIAAEMKEDIDNLRKLDFTASNDRRRLIRSINQYGSKDGIQFFSIDLEWGILSRCSDDVLDIAVRVTSEFTSIRRPISRVDLARKLGSKVSGGPIHGRKVKSPVLRARIAENLPLNELPPEVRRVLAKVIEAGVGPSESKQVNAELKSLGIR